MQPFVRKAWRQQGGWYLLVTILLLNGCIAATPPAEPPPSTDAAAAASAAPAEPSPPATVSDNGTEAEPTASVPELATPTPAERLLAAARQQLGRPYRRGGKNPERGFDCSGLVWYLHRQLDMDIPRSSIEQHRAARPVPRDQLRPGDLVFFRIYRGTISHVGVYSGDGHFIHAPVQGKGVSTARLDDTYWRKRFAGAGRFLSGD